jgi:flagellar biosynthesis protein
MSGKEKKPRIKAVALQYEPSVWNAPVVTAKGQGFIAEKIIALARKHHIPVKDDPDLVEILSRLELDEQIPPAVYPVVAELLAFVYHLNRKYQEEGHARCF